MKNLLLRSLLPFLAIIAAPVLAPAQSDSSEVEEDPWTLDEEFRMGPPFGQGTTGGHLSFGFALSGIDPAELDPEYLGGAMILSTFELTFMRKGLLLGGSWTTAMLYDAPLYDEFVFDHKGLLLGYDYSLFYGDFGIRPAVMVGRGDIVMIRTRPDITYDSAANRSGNEILERIREDDFWVIRPSLSLNWSPGTFVHFRLEGGYLYPTGGEFGVEDLRKPFGAMHLMFGSSR